MKYWELMEAAKDNDQLYKGQWLATRKHGEHGAGFLITLGKLWPETPRQIKNFLKERCCLDVIGLKDACLIESLLNKYGYLGEYKFTKGKNWVRLANQSYLFASFSNELKQINFKK